MIIQAARAVVRGSHAFLLLWLALAVVLLWAAPDFREVAVSDDSAYLPPDSAARHGEALLAETWPEASLTNTLAVAAIRDDRAISEDDLAVLRDLLGWLRSPSAPDAIGPVTTHLEQPDLAEVLVAEGNTAVLLLVSLDAGAHDPEGVQAVEGVREHLATLELPPGLGLVVTGAPAVAVDEDAAIESTVGRTTWLSLLLVSAILLYIFRSPLAIVVPLATVGAAYLVSLGLVSLLAERGFEVSYLYQTFAIVIVFGAGTDYSLLVMSRFGEQLDRHGDLLRADHALRHRTMVLVLAALAGTMASAAGSTIIGFSAQSVADFGLFRTMGPALALTVAVTLLAGLSLTPALMRLLGRFLFWPRFAQRDSLEPSRAWGAVSRAVGRRPVVTLAVSLVPLLGAAALLPLLQPSHDSIANLGEGADSVRAFRALDDHVPAGQTMPVVVVVEGSEPLTGARAFETLTVLSRTLLDLDGVASLRSAPLPTGGRPLTEADDRFGPYLGLGTALEGVVRRSRDLARALGRVTGHLDAAAGGALDVATAVESLAGRQAGGPGPDGDLVALVSDLRERVSLAGLEAARARTDLLPLLVEETAAALDAVAVVDTATAPPALREGVEELAGALAELDDPVAGPGAALDKVAAAIGGVAAAVEGITDVALSSPEAPGPGSGQAVRGDLEELAAVLGAIAGTVGDLTGGVARLAEGAERGVGEWLDAELHLVADPVDDQFVVTPAMLQALPQLTDTLSFFLSPDLRRTRLVVSLGSGAFSGEAIEAAGDIERATAAVLEGTGLRFWTTGTAAFVREVDRAAARDFPVIVAAVVAGVFAVLALLLRSVVIPVYLVLSVVLTYAASLGLTAAVFQGLLGDEGIRWWLPSILFVMLVVLGVDYSIFLMSRVREEARQRATVDAVPEGLRYTGRVITSCGLILAGTFSALMLAPMRSLVQLGFAATVGILIDTFVVRALLVPSVARLLGRWNWWPSRRAAVP